MMGTKTRAEVRKELLEAIMATGENPFEWLNAQMRKTPQNNDVLESLKRFLEQPVKPKRRRPTTKAKKLR
jgi:hypothetical protein